MMAISTPIQNLFNQKWSKKTLAPFFFADAAGNDINDKAFGFCKFYIHYFSNPQQHIQTR